MIKFEIPAFTGAVEFRTLLFNFFVEFDLSLGHLDRHAQRSQPSGVPDENARAADHNTFHKKALIGSLKDFENFGICDDEALKCLRRNEQGLPLVNAVGLESKHLLGRFCVKLRDARRGENPYGGGKQKFTREAGLDGAGFTR